MAAKSLDWLVKVNDFLEQVPEGISKYFKALSKSSEALVQTQVDIICAWLAWKVNIMVERKRQQVVQTLSEQYGGYLQMFAAVNVVKQAVSDPIGAIGGFLGKFAAPITAVIDFFKTLLKEIPRLAANLANIANSLPPDPPNPHINYNAFRLRIGTISLGEVISGGAGTPSPEEMFPEPPRPFSKEAFNASFEGAKAVAAEEEVVFKLPKKSTKITSGGIEKSDTTIA